MNRSTAIKLISILICMLIGFAIAQTLYFFELWYSRAQGLFIAFLTTSYVIPLAFLGQNFLNISKTRNKIYRILYAFLISGVFSFVWVISIQFIIGLWIMPMEGPLFLVLMTGSFFQLLYLDKKLPKPNENDPLNKNLRGIIVFPFAIALCFGVNSGLFLLGKQLSEHLSQPSDEKLEKVLKSDNIYILYKGYGGFAGYNETDFHLKVREYDTLLIQSEGTDIQTFTAINKYKMELLKQYITESYKTHEPGRDIYGSCSHFDRELIIRSGMTRMCLKPGSSGDSLLSIILYDSNK